MFEMVALSRFSCPCSNCTCTTESKMSTLFSIKIDLTSYSLEWRDAYSHHSLVQNERERSYEDKKEKEEERR